VGRTRNGKRRITDSGVQRPGERDRACSQTYRDRGMADTTTTDVSVPANSGKRRVGSVPGNDKPSKRVRFAGQVEIGGVDGLKQQLERWSKECVVCYFVGGDEAGRSQTHTVWECRQEVAEEVRARSREMAARMRTVAARGGCAGRGVRGAADDMQAVAVGSAVGGERGSVPVQGRVDFDDDGDADVGPGGWAGAGWGGRSEPVV
jgi:hypothetical protein